VEFLAGFSGIAVGLVLIALSGAVAMVYEERTGSGYHRVFMGLTFFWLALVLIIAVYLEVKA
jgi:hypothetical protein